MAHQQHDENGFAPAPRQTSPWFTIANFKRFENKNGYLHRGMLPGPDDEIVPRVELYVEAQGDKT